MARFREEATMASEKCREHDKSGELSLQVEIGQIERRLAHYPEEVRCIIRLLAVMSRVFCGIDRENRPTQDEPDHRACARRKLRWLREPLGKRGVQCVIASLRAMGQIEKSKQVKECHDQLIVNLETDASPRDSRASRKLPESAPRNLSEFSLILESVKSMLIAELEQGWPIGRAPGAQAACELHRLFLDRYIANESNKQELGANPRGMPTAVKPILNPPCDNAIKAFRAHKIMGVKQVKVAEELEKNPGQVSRWCSQVSKWLDAGNVLPGFSGDTCAKTITMDPAKIGMGKRQHRGIQTRRMGNRQHADSDE